jgi:hypothetical protein
MRQIKDITVGKTKAGDKIKGYMDDSHITWTKNW